MKLHIRHTFPFPPEQFWRCFDDPAWEAEEKTFSDVSGEQLEEHQEGPVTVRRTRFRSGIRLPAMVAGALGSETLHYDQISRIDREAGRLDWEVIPPAMQDKVVAKGVMWVRPIPGGCEQVVEGEVSVSVPLVGRKIEQGVVDGITKSHEVTAERRRAWVAQHYA